MSWDRVEGFLPHVKSGADLSAAANQYKLVKLDANGDIVLAAAATDVVVGSLYNTPALGEAAKVAYAGVVLVQADAALNEGVQVRSSADGQAADGSTPPSYVFGITVEAAGAAGDIIPVLARPHYDRIA